MITPGVSDPATTSAKVLWTALRTAAVQDTFTKIGFENHPAISSAYARFMLTKMPTKKVLELVLQVGSLETRMKAVEDLANQAKKVADAASSIASANKKKKAKGASSGDAASEV